MHCRRSLVAAALRRHVHSDVMRCGALKTDGRHSIIGTAICDTITAAVASTSDRSQGRTHTGTGTGTNTSTAISSGTATITATDRHSQSHRMVGGSLARQLLAKPLQLRANLNERRGVRDRRGQRRR